MRRKDREVKENSEIFDILSRCDTIRVGIQGSEFPYVVPVSFGEEIVDGKPIIYFHCAKQGLKTELLKENPNVCIEGDIFIKIEKTGHGITTRFESVIGFGNCEEVNDPEEILKGLRLLTTHYGYDDYPLDRCKGLPQVKIYKIRVEKIYGKKNLPENSLDY